MITAGEIDWLETSRKKRWRRLEIIAILFAFGITGLDDMAP